MESNEFKAGQEVPKHGDKIMVGKKAGTYCCPDPVLENYHVVVMDHDSTFLSLLLGDIRPIPAQPTMESEIENILAKINGRTYTDKDATRDILAWHQKHSGRVEVSDEEIIKERQRRGYQTLQFEMGAMWMRDNFMTRKEQQG